MFPSQHFINAGSYFDQYCDALKDALLSVDRDQIIHATDELRDALSRDATIFCCGNGGSAAISNHMVCDHQKGIHTGTHYLPKIVSLSSNIELLTAIGNDIGFSDVFSFPLKLQARDGDILFVVSSSGNSENIVRALATAADMGLTTIAMTGFSGGRARALANISIHVESENYGVIEDVHQSLMHVMAQYIRHRAMPLELIWKSTF